jgi:hypothetical protein
MRFLAIPVDVRQESTNLDGSGRRMDVWVLKGNGLGTCGRRALTLQSGEQHTERVEERASMPNSPFEEFGRKVDEHISNVTPRVEEEVRKVIAYLNDEVVPTVKQNSSEALRIAADQLRKLADHLERK